MSSEQHEPDDAYGHCNDCGNEWPCAGELWNRNEALEARAFKTEQQLAIANAKIAALEAALEDVVVMNGTTGPCWCPVDRPIMASHTEACRKARAARAATPPAAAAAGQPSRGMDGGE